MTTLRVTILGCGSSGGVPRATGDWGVCDPTEPRNRRTRCSILVQRWQARAAGRAEEATTVLIDTAPDLRSQLAEAKPSHLDAVLYTHDHADQVHGIDDLRAFVLQARRRVPVWMDAATRKTLHQRFHYCFQGYGGYPSILEEAGELKPYETISVDGPGGPIDFVPLAQDHGYVPSLGFRFGPCAYSNDVVGMPPETFAALAGLDVWIVDALRETPHPSHAHLAMTLDWISDVRPRRAILTNMHIDLDYRRMLETLPANVEPAFDGQRIDLTTP